MANDGAVGFLNCSIMIGFPAIELRTLIVGPLIHLVQTGF
jgi:hypothetical protein